ncbi:hypothetical protein F5879DRAFT_312810 [Lentinula edodes]|nr:hypothetical protein F5879DRAFT_312810 [Lentinula edodes]
MRALMKSVQGYCWFATATSVQLLFPKVKALLHCPPLVSDFDAQIQIPVPLVIPLCQLWNHLKFIAVNDSIYRSGQSTVYRRSRSVEWPKHIRFRYRFVPFCAFIIVHRGSSYMARLFQCQIK